MPSPALIAGIPVVGQVASAIMQGVQNKKSRKWSEKMYAQQRQDSLSDFNMQNEYNSPEATMQRLKAAGLNPNLVYGDGATSTAAPIRSSSVEKAEFNAPQFDTGAVLGAYYQQRNADLQTDNLRKQNELLAEQAQTQRVQQMMTASNINKTNVDADLSQFELSLKRKLENNSLQMAEGNLRKLAADTQYTLDNNDRQAAQNSASLQEAAERILRSRAERANLPAQRQLIYAQIENLKKEGKLKDLDTRLKAKGIQPSDNLIFRVIGQFFDKENIKKIIPKSWDEIKKFDPLNPYGK